MKNISLLFILFLAFSVNAQVNKLVAYYPLNGNFQDFSGKGHDGVETNLSYDDDRNINPSGACVFSGSSGFSKVAASSDFSFGTNDFFTITFWMKAFSYGTYASMISKCEESDTSGYCLGFDLNGKFRFISNLLYPVFSTQQVPLNSWQHFAVTYAEGIVKIYINGSLNNTGSVVTLNKNTHGIILGRMCNSKNNGSDFNGLLDEVKIFNTELTGAEISTLFATGIDPQQDALNAIFIAPTLVTQNQPITLNAKFALHYEVTMADALGRTVFEGMNTESIETTNLPNGMYFLYCRLEGTNSEFKQVRKIVINK